MRRGFMASSSSDRGRGDPQQSLNSGVQQQYLYGVPHGVPQRQAGSLMPESEIQPNKKPRHPFWKIVRHKKTGQVEIRKYYEIFCRNGYECQGAESGSCWFQHYSSAEDWVVTGNAHNYQAAVVAVEQIVGTFQVVE